MERIGSDVRRELDRFGPIGTLGELVDAWPAAVGAAIARNAWPARVNRDRTLVVHCADSVWAFELGQRAAEIATRLGVPRLRFVPGPVPEAGPEVAAGGGRVGMVGGSGTQQANGNGQSQCGGNEKAFSHERTLGGALAEGKTSATKRGPLQIEN